MKPIKNSRGIAIVYVTLFLMVLGLLFLALGIDVGWLAFVRSQGQAAVDAGALRGAAATPNYNNTAIPDNVYSMVSGLNASNAVMNQSADLSSSNIEFCTGTPDNPTCCLHNDPDCPVATIPAGGIRVTKPYTAPLYFGKLFKNGNTADLMVGAIGWLGGPGAYCSDIPIALCAADIGYTPNTDGTFTCEESLDAELIPNTTDNAGWYAPLPETANAAWCQAVLRNGDRVCTASSDVIDLNNGEITVCQRLLAQKFADNDCFTPPVYDDEGNVIVPGVEGTKCTLDAEHPERVACTATLPVVNCPGSINPDLPVIGYASVCIKYIQALPASEAVTKVNLECSATAPGPGGGVFLGTYASRPVLVK